LAGSTVITPETTIMAVILPDPAPKCAVDLGTCRSPERWFLSLTRSTRPLPKGPIPLVTGIFVIFFTTVLGRLFGRIDAAGQPPDYAAVAPEKAQVALN
jgi:hypothetical protein